MNSDLRIIQDTLPLYQLQILGGNELLQAPQDSFSQLAWFPFGQPTNAQTGRPGFHQNTLPSPISALKASSQRGGREWNGQGHLNFLAEPHVCVGKMEFASTHWIIPGAKFSRGHPSLPKAKAEWALHAPLKADADIPGQALQKAFKA